MRSASLFHPHGGTWSTTAALQTRRDEATGTLLPNGQVLVAGGEQASGHLLRSAELYDSLTHTWYRAGAMHVARTGASESLLRDGTVLICGGADFDGPLASCELFHQRLRSDHF
jgi:hypothetical protein